MISIRPPVSPAPAHPSPNLCHARTEPSRVECALTPPTSFHRIFPPHGRSVARCRCVQRCSSEHFHMSLRETRQAQTKIIKDFDKKIEAAERRHEFGYATGWQTSREPTVQRPGRGPRRVSSVGRVQKDWPRTRVSCASVPWVCARAQTLVSCCESCWCPPLLHTAQIRLWSHQDTKTQRLTHG